MSRGTDWVALIPPRRALLAGAICCAVGLTAAVGAVALEVPQWSQLSIVDFLLAVALPVLFGTMVIAVGVLLLLPKGALFWNATSRQLLVSSGLPSSRLLLDVREIHRLYLFHRREPWEKYHRDYFSLEAHLRGGGFLLLGESEAYQNSLIVGREIARLTRLVLADLTEMDRQIATSDSPPVVPQPELTGIRVDAGAESVQYRWRSGVGSAYYLIIGLIGLVALVLGVTLSMAMRTSIAAVFFGPVMVCCGLGALATIAENWLAEETLVLSPSMLQRSTGFAGLRWGYMEDRLDSDFRLRLRASGIRGYGLELVTASRTLLIGAGFTARARVKPPAVLALIADIHRRREKRLTDA